MKTKITKEQQEAAQKAEAEKLLESTKDDGSGKHSDETPNTFNLPKSK